MEDGDGNFHGGDRAEQFHRNEAISAVADDGFLGEEEEDEDYEDLYNDVNVGEGFLGTLRPEDEIEDSKKPIEPPEPPPVSIPGVGGSSSSSSSRGVDGKAMKSEVPGGDFKPAQDSIFRGTDAGARVPAMKVEMGESSPSKFSEMQGQFGQSNPRHVVGGNSFATASASSNNANVNGGGSGGGPGPGVGPAPSGGVGVVPTASVAGGTVLYVGELHWWTTDAELESELSKYGAVKELKFYDEKASGKSKGYCQVEFYDPAAAAACKEGMNGHVFNGRPCVVAFASPMTVRKMGEAMMNKNQPIQQGPGHGRRGQADGGRGSGVGPGASFQNFGRGGWPRGGGAMGNRGPIGSMRGRGGMGGRGIIGNSGNGFGQGMPSAAPPFLQPQAMMGQGFDPTYGTMGRMGGGYGGFPGATVPPFSGLLSPYPGVSGVGLPGVAPHVNPAFFGRGMPANGMGMMPSPGVENAGMWSDPSVSGWAGEEQGGRAGESSYGEDALSEQQFGETSRDRGWSNASREKDRALERDAPDRRYRDDRESGWDREGTRERDTGRDQDWSERRHRGDREAGRDRDRDRERERDRDRDRDRYREDRERYSDYHRYKDRDMEHDDEWDRARSSRSHQSKPRLSHEEEQRHRLRDVEHGKRRRLSSE